MRPLTLYAAGALSLISAGMSAAAALERGGSPADTVLLVSIGVAITLAVHLLPALTRSAAGRALWLACIALTLYSHATYFHAAGNRAGQQRAQAVQPGTHTAALREQLQHITARAPSDVGSDLASAQGRATTARLALQRCEQATAGRCAALSARVDQAAATVQALQIEATDAARAVQIRQQLADAAARIDTQRQTAAADPIAAGLAALLHLSPDAVALLVSVLCASVLDLLAALLWSQALCNATATPATPREPATPPVMSLAQRIAATVAPTTAPTPPARRMQPQSTAPPAVHAFRRRNDNHHSGATP